MTFLGNKYFLTSTSTSISTSGPSTSTSTSTWQASTAYKYQYSTVVLKYRSSTSNSTQYNKTGCETLIASNRHSDSRLIDRLPGVFRTWPRHLRRLRLGDAMRTHVCQTVSRCFAALRQLRRIRHLVSTTVFQSLVTDLVLSRLTTVTERWSACRSTLSAECCGTTDISSPPIWPHHGRAHQLTLVTSAGKDCVQGRSADLPGTARWCPSVPAAVYTSRRHPVPTKTLVFHLGRSVRSCRQTAYCWTSCFLCCWRSCLECSSCRRHFSTFSVHFPKTFKTASFSTPLPGLVL